MSTTQTFDADYWRARFHAHRAGTAPLPSAVDSALPTTPSLPPRRAENTPARTDEGLESSTLYLNIPEGLPKHVRKTLQVIQRLASELADVRRQRLASIMTFHLPQELLAAHLGIHKVTLWRHLNILEEKGLVSVRAHFTTSKGTTRADGSVWAVAMKENVWATLTHADLAHQYRDLDGDRRDGRTAWALVQQSDSTLETEKGFLLLKDWAVGNFQLSPVESDHCTNSLEAVWNLEELGSESPRHRAEAVTRASEALAAVLNDRHSRRFYAALLWKSLQAEYSGTRPLRALSHAVTRVVADMREGFARRPGALLMSRLKEGGWLDATLALSTPSPRLL